MRVRADSAGVFYRAPRNKLSESLTTFFVERQTTFNLFLDRVEKGSAAALEEALAVFASQKVAAIIDPTSPNLASQIYKNDVWVAKAKSLGIYRIRKGTVGSKKIGYDIAVERRSERMAERTHGELNDDDEADITSPSPLSQIEKEEINARLKRSNASPAELEKCADKLLGKR